MLSLSLELPPDAEDARVQRNERQPEQRRHALQGGRGGTQAEARLPGGVQVQAQVALHRLAQPLQQVPLQDAQQLGIQCLHRASVLP